MEAVAGSDALIEADDENSMDPDYPAEDLEAPDYLRRGDKARYVGARSARARLKMVKISTQSSTIRI